MENFYKRMEIIEDSRQSDINYIVHGYFMNYIKYQIEKRISEISVSELANLISEQVKVCFQFFIKKSADEIFKVDDEESTIYISEKFFDEVLEEIKKFVQDYNLASFENETNNDGTLYLCSVSTNLRNLIVAHNVYCYASSAIDFAKLPKYSANYLDEEYVNNVCVPFNNIFANCFIEKFIKDGLSLYHQGKIKSRNEKYIYTFSIEKTDNTNSGFISSYGDFPTIYVNPNYYEDFMSVLSNYCDSYDLFLANDGNNYTIAASLNELADAYYLEKQRNEMLIPENKTKKSVGKALSIKRIFEKLKPKK